MLKNLSKEERLKRNLLKVGEIAEEAGILRSTVFYYVNEGLLDVADYTQGKYRLFKKEETLARIARIKQLQDKGLTLDEIERELKGFFKGCRREKH